MVCSVCASYDSQRAFGADDYAFREDPSIHRFTPLFCNPRTRRDVYVTLRYVTLRYADMPQWSAKIFTRCLCSMRGTYDTRCSPSLSRGWKWDLEMVGAFGSVFEPARGFGSRDFVASIRLFVICFFRAVVGPCLVRTTRLLSTDYGLARLDMDLDFGASIVRSTFVPRFRIYIYIYTSFRRVYILASLAEEQQNLSRQTKLKIQSREKEKERERVLSTWRNGKGGE